ncbi:tautomerase family protein [Elstera litoralis]|nr:tautomerase family protein [Elstera litoralis]
MPLVRLDLPEALAPQARPIADAVHSALVSAIGIPADDRFQIINIHNPAHLIIDANYLGIARSPNALIVQIYLRQGRTVELKKGALCRHRRQSRRARAAGRGCAGIAIRKRFARLVLRAWACSILLAAYTAALTYPSRLEFHG